MIKFLLRGLLRDRHRSLFPILIVSLGVMMTVFFQAYFTGVFSDMIDYMARYSSGHVKVMTRAYAENVDQNPNDLALMNVSELVRTLQEQYPDMTWVHRIQYGGLLDIPDENGETRSQGPVIGMGVDLLTPGSTENTRLNIEKALVQGRMPQQSGEILISEEIAYKWQVAMGGQATLLGSTMYGSMAMHNFSVVGTVRFGITVMDRGAMIADIIDVQAALDMQDAAGEVLGYFGNEIYQHELAAEIVDRFNAANPDPEDEFAPVMLTLKEASKLSEYIDMAAVFSGIVVTVFIVVMSIVLWNAGLLGGLRRYGEVGLRLAIGEHKGHVYRSMIYESLLVGIVGSVIGTAVGLGFAYWLQIKGLDISSLMKNMTMMMPSKFRAMVTTETYYIGFFPGLFSTALGTSLSGIGIYKRQTAHLFKELEA